MLSHVFDPIAVLEACRRAIKREGWLIVETSYLFDEGAARMSFSPADETARGIDRANVFWRPSRRALEGMFRGPRGPRRVYPALYRPQVPLQPAWRPRRELDRYAKVARSAWFHARTALGEGRASLRLIGRAGR